MPRLYLDTCCLNRPFDDQSQERVRAETGAIWLILEEASRGRLELIRSEAVEMELERIVDLLHRDRVLALASVGTVRAPVLAEDFQRGRVLETLGFKQLDALHIACAESGGADVLLTTDDGMVRRARRLPHVLRVPVRNPLTWQQEASPR